MNLNFYWNNFLCMVRKTLFFRYKFHCNICGYPTDDINNLHSHGTHKHPDIMRQLISPDNNVI